MNTKSLPAREWRVFVHSREVGDIGSVVESPEELARCAALSRYGIADDDEFVEVQEGVNGPIGILIDDDFDVRPA